MNIGILFLSYNSGSEAIVRGKLSSIVFGL